MARGARATVAATVILSVSAALAALARTERSRRTGRSRVGARQRHFGLLVDETAAHGLRRIALGQLDLAIELLLGEGGIAPEHAVHETRKALKRLRALLRLLEPQLGPQRVAPANATLRSAADRLSRARDAQVMVATLDQLLARHPRRLGRRAPLLELRHQLEHQHLLAAARLLGDPPHSGANGSGTVIDERARAHSLGERALVAHDLAELRAQMHDWSLRDRPALELVGHGLDQIYRDGRTRYRRVARRPKPKQLHRWRKDVKDLRYAAEVLDVQSIPPAPTAHADPARRPLARLARRADALGELLGEEHDLALLRQIARSHQTLAQRKRARRALLRAIARRRARVRQRALRRGASLYSRPSKQFLKRARARVRKAYARAR